MKNFIKTLLLCAVFASAAVFSPSSSTLAILLDASGLCDETSSESWDKMQTVKFLRENAFYGDSNSIFCFFYDDSMTPAEAADSLLKGKNSIFNKALKNWAQNSNAANSEQTPNRFVIIAEGVAGLAVREYIQSKDYQGEIENVLFFNTPHEGTGFADQTLLNGSSALNKSKSASDYSDIIPLALAIYLIGGGGALEDLMMSLLKEAVLGMVQNAGDIKKHFSGYFENKEKSYKSLLYLAEDLDLQDAAYREVQKNAQEKGLDLKNFAGSTQLLNAYSMLNSYEHPAYNNIYSYGLPSIGNGRRTLADFADQAKNHVSKERLQKMLTESLSAMMAKNGKDFVPEDIQSVVSNAMNGDFTADAMQAANRIASDYDIPVGQIAECVRDISSLSNLKFNKENFSSSVLKTISIANKYLPEKYKSELFSTFIDEYSQTLSELGESVQQIEGNLKKGTGLLSSNLSNYAIHFFDEGTFDVPAFSAIGKNVRAFKESGVMRIGYSLKDYAQAHQKDFSELKDYMNYTSKAGELEGIRQDIDLGLKIGCSAVEAINPAIGKACRAAQFLTNVTLIANVSQNIKKAVQNVGALRSAKYIAIKQSIEQKPAHSSWHDHNGISHDIASSDMENMLFGTPIISLQTVRKSGISADSIVPLALYKTFDDVKNFADISQDSLAYGYLFPASEFSEIPRNALTHNRFVMMKDVFDEQRNGSLYKKTRYAAVDGFRVSDFIREYRFIIDDFQPDELHLIQFDFNARMQLAYERRGHTWYVYRGLNNQWEENPIDTLQKSPIQKNGLFVFRPKEVLNKGITDKKDSILLSAIQEDGANCISIYIVNKAGKANNQRIAFKFQAVDYLIEEGWPKSFETVSQMDTVEIYANDLGYGASLGEYRLIVSSLKHQDTVPVFVDSLKGSGSRYRFKADLSSIWKKHPLENAAYTLQWHLGFKTKTLKEDYTSGEQNIYYNPKTIVWGDVSAPSLAFDTLSKSPVFSLNKGETFAYVQSLDSVENRPLRGLRSFLVRKDTKDTLWLLHQANVGEPSYGIRWTGAPVSWSGVADLYAQAYDFANPNFSMKAKLANTAQDSARSSWAFALIDSTFRAGINGTSIHQKILLDNAPPQASAENLKVLGVADKSLPAFAKRKNGDEVLLNAMDTLLLSFDIEENLFGRDSEIVVVELVFTDSLDRSNLKQKRYLYEFTVSNSTKRFVFQEPDANRIEDGIYTLNVFLTDEAGNKSSKQILKNVRVDRTLPQIRGITLGDFAYENIAELKKGSAHVSQSADDARNRSELVCYVKVNFFDKEGSWKGPLPENTSKTAQNANIHFDFGKAAPDTTHGIWFVYFGCYDDAGNFGKNINSVEIGARYPKITHPQNDFYSGPILIRGFAPNHLVHENDNLGEFRISWRKEEDSTWSEKGIQYLVFDKSLLPSERDLAIWNPAECNLARGSYVLKLSVRSCDSCPWISDEKIVFVNDVAPFDSANVPKLVIAPPVGNHRAGQAKDISIELKNVPEDSRWLVKAFIEVPSPKDSTTYVRALEKTFDPMTVSPFKTLAATSDSGLSIWQENDGCTWHVRHAGNALGLKITDSTKANPTISRMPPYLAIRFVEGEVNWNHTTLPDSSSSLSFVMDSIRIQNEGISLTIPPYNATKLWNVGKDSVHLVFQTTKPFTVDASWIEGAFFEISQSPVLYVFPEKYKAHIVWDGLINGSYSSGSLARLNVIAYEKGNEKHILSEEAKWYLEYENPKIEIAPQNLEKYYVNFLGSNADSSEMQLADYGFQFKLTERSAYVTAEILDSAKNVVRTLLDNKLVLATATNQWQTLSWNGVKDDGLVLAGSYAVHLLVKSESGIVIDTLYPFEMTWGTDLVEAKKDSAGQVADLKMLETFLDENGNYRYIGKPDYILQSNVSATILPENERTFLYEWDIYGGIQKPIVYKKTRPSIGIRRHRDEFWATVVTLLMSESRVYQVSWCGLSRCCFETGIKESRGYWYRMDVQRVQFKKGESNKEILVDLDSLQENDSRIYGYKSNNIEVLHNLAAIKIFPASSFETIESFIGNSMYNAVWDAGFSSTKDFAWENVYKKNSYMNNTNSQYFHQMSNWFNNWGQPLYYEAVDTNLNIISNAGSLLNAFNAAISPCETDDIESSSLSEDDSRFVCGAKNAKEEIDPYVVQQYNPHAFMMDVQLKPFDGEKSFVIKKFEKNYCSEMDNSGSDIKVKFVLQVNPDYWEPKIWGTNNLANRYARFDPLSKTLYGNDGYITKLVAGDFLNFYNGSTWVADSRLNNGPTVFEVQRLPMWPIPENPLLFNDEILAYLPDNKDSSVKYYPSEFSWRFYRGSGDINYKAETRTFEGNLLASFQSNEQAALNGEDKSMGKIQIPYGFYFDVAPTMNITEAKNAGILLSHTNTVAYPLDEGNCSVHAETGNRFYGCDKWVSHLHSAKNDWNDSLWKSRFALKNGQGFIRNPLTDSSVIFENLTAIETPKIDSNNKKLVYHITPKNWSTQHNFWSFKLEKPKSDIDEILGGISVKKYILKSDEGNSEAWKIDSSTTDTTTFSLFNQGKNKTSELTFYRARDSIFTSEKGLNNGGKSEAIPLARVVAQSPILADTIIHSDWAKNPSAEIVGIFKRKMPNDTNFTRHPYFNARYDSTAKQFAVSRNSSDIYASRENEMVTLQGRIPYNITDWKISYIQNGMRFKIAEGTKEPIEATMDVNRLQGNTSFFLTYKGIGDVTYYRQLDVRIGEQVKANAENFVYSMYGNVSVHFEKDSWTSDADVTVRTMDPSECYDCQLFRNMHPTGPVIEVLPSHVFPDGKSPLVTVDISMETLKNDGVDFRNLKIYKLEKKEIVPLEKEGAIVLLDAELQPCKAADPYSCAFARINAKTPTFSKFIVLDSANADSVMFIDSLPEKIEAFSCYQLDSLWLDTLWMGTANGWFEFPYPCTGKSNYLLQLSIQNNVSAEHRGASTFPIVWPIRNTDLAISDSVYQSSIVFYGIDGNTEQKLGPTVRLDSIAPIIESVETSISEDEESGRSVHVEVEINEIGSGMAKSTLELFLGGNLLQSVTIPGNAPPIYDFQLDRKSLYACVGCQATIKVIAEDKGHNTDEAVKQTEKLYPYPSSLVLWYPFAEGSGNIGYELMTKENPRRMHFDLSAINAPWNGRYGVHLYKATDSASSRYTLAALDSLRPFTFELNFNAGNIQQSDWAILSFVGQNEWTFGLGTYNRYFLKVGSDVFYFNTKRDANIPTHLAVVVEGKNASLYKNGKLTETIRLKNELLYGGKGKLAIGTRNGLRSAVGNISNLRFYASALSAEQIQNLFAGVPRERSVHIASVRAVTLSDRNGLTVDQSCSAPGKAYLRQNTTDNSGKMTWKVDLDADDYTLYLFHRNYITEESEVEVTIDGTHLGKFKLNSTGLWKSEQVADLHLPLKAGVHEMTIRPMGNLGIAALALASSQAGMDGNMMDYGESSWTIPEEKVQVRMKYETLDDKKWAQIRFDLRNKTDKALENAKIRYYYKGEGENVNAVAFYPSSPMRVVNDAGSVFYAEFALTEVIAAYGTAYFGQGPLIGLHRLTSPSNYFPYWDITDDPSYIQEAEKEYAEATGVALLDAEGNLLNEFSCYDEDGPIQKAKRRVRAMARDNSEGSNSESHLAIYVENTGSVPVDGFETRYYFRDTAQTELDIYWNAFAQSSKVSAGGDLYYVSFLYDDILNAGDKSDYGNGVQFSLHHPNRTHDFNAADDPSHYNLNNREMVEADSIVVLDRQGNLLWGNAPQPKFRPEYIVKENHAKSIYREGDIVYVNIEESGYYTLETVNAIGVPLKKLYKGSWEAGEHSVTLDMKQILPSSYIVLRKNSEILAWELLN